MNLTERTNAALAWIDKEIALCSAATKGSWRVDGISSAMVWSTDIRPTLISTGSRDDDARFIAAARNGYPAMLEGMKVAIEWLRYMTPGMSQTESLNEILAKIENLK